MLILCPTCCYFFFIKSDKLKTGMNFRNWFISGRSEQYTATTRKLGPCILMLECEWKAQKRIVLPVQWHNNLRLLSYCVFCAMHKHKQPYHYIHVALLPRLKVSSPSSHHWVRVVPVWLIDSGPVYFHVNPKYFLFHSSYWIFKRMYGALNVGKKIINCIVCL
jgi:hypothetical protein